MPVPVPPAAGRHPAPLLAVLKTMREAATAAIQGRWLERRITGVAGGVPAGQAALAFCPVRPAAASGLPRRPGRRSLPVRQPVTLTFSAWGPFWPCVMSNSTRCPSSRLR